MRHQTRCFPLLISSMCCYRRRLVFSCSCKTLIFYKVM